MANKQTHATLLGIGLDSDGQVRITRGDNFHLVGGTATTHETMQEQCIKFNEKLADRGKQLAQLERQEFLDLARQCDMNIAIPASKR